MAFLQLTQQGTNTTHLVNINQIVSLHRVSGGCAVLTTLHANSQINVQESFERISGAIAVAHQSGGGGILMP
jgi:hypothetical protein